MHVLSKSGNGLVNFIKRVGGKRRNLSVILLLCVVCYGMIGKREKDTCLFREDNAW